MNTYWIIFFIGLYGLLLSLERLRPLRQPNRVFLPRFITNITMTVLVVLISSITIQPTVSLSIQATQQYGWGLFPWLGLNEDASFWLGFLALDASFYYWHLMNHKIPVLWRFHNVHHVDPDLDVTTAMRFHGGEIAYSSLFRVLQLCILGVSPFCLLAYELCFQAAILFHHSNIKLPLWLERPLSNVVVTPRVHGIHHSNYLSETDRNFGVLFTFWDRIHGTFKRNVAQKDITIGVPAYDKDVDNSFKQLLIMPFVSQKNYWFDEGNDHRQRSLPHQQPFPDS